MLLRAARTAAAFVELDGLTWEEAPGDGSRHVHPLMGTRRKGRRFLAKSADVFRRIGAPGTQDYRSFYLFVSSLFEDGEATLPVCTLRFPDQPEARERTYRRSEVLRDPELLRSLADTTPPHTIVDPSLRSLFVYYLSRKEAIISANEVDYENVFTHRGRDVILEVFASLLGRALGVRVPQNRIGVRTFEFTRAGQAGRFRRRMPYVLSALVAAKGNIRLNAFLRSAGRVDLARALDLEMHRANPLSLEFFLEETVGARRETGAFLLESLPRARDLMRSDLLDVLLNAREDRSIQEFLLPRGESGPVYTVDYGESLFAELALDPEEPHFQRASRESLEWARRHFHRMRELPADNPYRLEGMALLGRLKALPGPFFREFFANLPELLLGNTETTWGSFRPEAAVAHLEALRETLCAEDNP